jgi:hypothetical protein
MNELYKFEENELIIAEKVIEGIKDLERKKKLIEDRQKNMKQQLLEAMEKYSKDKWESPDGTLKVSYTSPSEVCTFDSNRFEKEHHDLYVQYLKYSPRKSSLRITVKDN